jgi:hypothetical protein
MASPAPRRSWDKQIGQARGERSLASTVDRVLVGDPGATALLAKATPPPADDVS